MKKLIIMMLGLLIVLAGCGGNKETAPEKQKEITMTDIIKSNKKHVIFVGSKYENESLVDSIVITKNGKAKVYNLSTNQNKIDLNKLANKSIDEIENIGEKSQKEQGYPKAYYTTAHVWFNDEFPEEVRYEFRGFSKYNSQYDTDKKEYQLGESEDKAHKYMERVQDFNKDGQLKMNGKPGYSFIGLPKSLEPIQQNEQASSTYLADEIDNNMISVDNGKLVGGVYGDNFVATKVSDKTTLKKEKQKNYNDNVMIKSYQDNNN